MDASRLRELVPIASLTVLAVTGSTNDDAARVAATDPGAEVVVVVADHQENGRGRLGRTWSAPPRTSVAVSVALRPAVAAVHWGWAPLLAGQAVRDTVAARVSMPGPAGTARVVVKWPNDVLVLPNRDGVGGGKISGILTEVRATWMIIGAGINTNLTPADAPVPTATSLRLATGTRHDPTEVVAQYLTSLLRWWQDWMSAGGDGEGSGLRAAHLMASDTVGRTVRVQTPGGGLVSGLAETVDEGGRLVVLTDAGRRVVLSAGDVVHVR